MKPTKYSSDKAAVVNLGTKVIYKFPTQTKLFELSRMVVNGRHPENPKEFILESDCHFMIYVIKGNGKIYAGEEIFSVSVGDVVDVPPRNKFACEGKGLEYITFDVPAFYPEQSEIITENDSYLYHSQ